MNPPSTLPGSQLYENDAPQMPIGVVIPTYNRVRHLLNALEHLARQTWKDFEVVVMDDGSTDTTRQEVERFRRTSPFPLTYLHHENSGQARGRNRAIAQLKAPICILIGDDIFPAPQFVETHLALHRAHPELEATAVGYTRWSESGQTVTRFMRWLDRDGMQFAYGDLFNGVAPTWEHFYTSNLSFKTRYLQENPFHERFVRYGMEDVELGYRLGKLHGLKMYFLPDAVADHLHPTDFRKACSRMVDVGAAGYLYGELWPEHRRPPESALRKLVRTSLAEPRLILATLTRLADLLTRWWCPNPLMKAVLRLHASVGYDRALANARQAKQPV